MRTLFWYDYETTGINSRVDRIVQFGGLRTDEALNPVGDPLMLYCRPTHDVLPSPESCLITRITPALAESRGISEAEFSKQILDVLTQAGTCAAGYNSIRFDDEFTRFLLYRNLYDPYAREWQNGNSRWDLLDVVRAAWALRPEGLQWPKHPDGKPSFRLEHLTEANGISHGQAHDALADVHATVELARRVRAAQPKLFDFLYTHRRKDELLRLIDFSDARPLIHCAGFYPNERGFLAPVLPVCGHAQYKNAVWFFDLTQDPAEWVERSTDELRELLLKKGNEARAPLQLVHLNKCPVISPISVLVGAPQERHGIDLFATQRRAEVLRKHSSFTAKVKRILLTPPEQSAADVDQALYSGGFLKQRDRLTLVGLHAIGGEVLGQHQFVFDDPRLGEMLFRYRARNYPESLTAEERRRWNDFRLKQLGGVGERGDGGLNWQTFIQQIETHLRRDELSEQDRSLLTELRSYGRDLMERIGFTAFDREKTTI